jgi:acetoin utilization deacetylase AcuC-like enzyme
MTTALLADPIYLRHKLAPGHPERPERYEAVISALEAAGLTAQMLRIPPRAATPDELSLCHTPAYIRLVETEIARGSHVLSTGDTDLCPASLDVALAAAGGVLSVVDAVMEGRAQNAFCVVRPPGHHASADRGMGFCLFNNVALAARHAQRRHGLERVLIADWDVHHGNGTQDIFYADGSVFFFSTHQSPWYPGTGSAQETGGGKGRGTTLNCPFAAGSGRAEILGAFERMLVPAVRYFKPQLILISAGFDSRAGDPLGDFTLSDQDFSDLTALLLELAATYAGGRLVSVLEGGYSLEGLASAAVAHVKALRTPGAPRR